MSQPLWYLRQHPGGPVIGPFPAAQVREFLRNGEITPAWEISLDEKDWLTILESGQFAPEGAEPSVPDASDEMSSQSWREERAQARHRWLHDTADIDQAEPHDLAMERRTRQALAGDRLETETLVQRQRQRRPPVVAGLLAVLVVLGAVYFIWQGQNRVSGIQAEIGLVANCAAPLADAVNWRRCDKRGLSASGVVARNTRMERVNLEGANLAGADLGYAALAMANLRNADLKGINLSGADLTGADLSGSDLSGADLRFTVLKDARLEGVRLAGARLGKAVWPDGHPCQEGAVGQCP
jgi:hypothetical protein